MDTTLWTYVWPLRPLVHSSNSINELPTKVSLISCTTCCGAKGNTVVIPFMPRAWSANNQLGHSLATTEHCAVQLLPTLKLPLASWYPIGFAACCSPRDSKEVRDSSSHSSSATFLAFPFALSLSNGKSKAAQALSALLLTWVSLPLCWSSSCSCFFTTSWSS